MQFDLSKEKCLVVLSGGQDSATCAAWAAKMFKETYFLSFNYGQRHIKELESATAIAGLFGRQLYVVPIPALAGNPASALTNQNLSCNEVNEASGLPKTFVPGRNLVFLTQAASIALSQGIRFIVTGVCQTDYSGYPDCRADTIACLEEAINLGNRGIIDGRFTIFTPLMYLTKRDTVMLAKALPNGMEAVALSWTCYEGGDEPCETCPACTLRAKGFAEAGTPDPAKKSKLTLV
jgi:7-cyano-7-deazaguanine synthase